MPAGGVSVVAGQDGVDEIEGDADGAGDGRLRAVGGPGRGGGEDGSCVVRLVVGDRFDEQPECGEHKRSRFPDGSKQLHVAALDGLELPMSGMPSGSSRSMPSTARMGASSRMRSSAMPGVCTISGPPHRGSGRTARVDHASNLLRHRTAGGSGRSLRSRRRRGPKRGLADAVAGVLGEMSYDLRPQLPALGQPVGRLTCQSTGERPTYLGVAVRRQP